jgi:hypothetical protein
MPNNFCPKLRLEAKTYMSENIILTKIDFVCSVLLHKSTFAVSARKESQYVQAISLSDVTNQI